jgi:ABC-type polysaccharide/polyol phosphate export permease
MSGFVAAPRILTQFMRDLVRSRHVLAELSKKELRSRYLGSYLGLVWAFVNPIVTIGIMWFVFTYGLRVGPVHDTPFILWLMAGMVPWFFFAETLLNGTGAIVENQVLVKKVVFRVSLLPVVKLITALAIHLIFVVLLLVVLAVQGRWPGWYALQLFYYLPAMIALLLGLNWLTCSLTVFARDLGHAMSVLLQFGVWLTPIMWNLDMIPVQYHVYFKLNPMFYIVKGYRNALIDSTWFWTFEWQMVYYWAMTALCMMLGAVVFRRLRPHFADVL